MKEKQRAALALVSLAVFAVLASPAPAQVAARPYNSPLACFYDANGDPLSGGKVYSYIAGTTTPQVTYSDSLGATPNANPLVLDSAGCGVMWLGTTAYKIVVKTSAGATISTTDNVPGTQSVVDINGGTIDNAVIGGTTPAAGSFTTINSVQMVPAKTLSAAVAACSANPCTIKVTGTETLAANVTVPATATLVFEDGGSIAGAYTLTVNGPLVAPETGQIFNAATTVAGLSEARPEWFGVTTLSKAVDALSSSGGTILLRRATYQSDYTSPGLAKDNVVFRGDKKPLVNAGKTALANGTIIQGRWLVQANGIELYDLGVDSGTAFGVESDALFVMPSGTSNLTGFVARNVSCLGYSAASPYHCFALEHVDGADVRNISSTYGAHGVVLKGTYSLIDGVDAQGHAFDVLILKCNGTDYGSCGHNVISNIRGRSISVVPPDTGGIVLETVDQPMDSVVISNVTLQNTKYGVHLGGAAGVNALTGVAISNFKVSGYGTGNGSDCVQYVGTSWRTSIANMICDNMDWGAKFDAASGANSVQFTAWTLTNMVHGVETYANSLQINGLQSNATGGAVIDQRGGSTYASNVYCSTSPCTSVTAGSLLMMGNDNLVQTQWSVDSAGKANFNGGLSIGTGVTNTAGFQHLTVSTCTTPASPWAFCDQVVDWSPNFANNDYDVSCQAIDAYGRLMVGPLVSKGGDSMTIRLFTNTGAAASGWISCIAVHNN